MRSDDIRNALQQAGRVDTLVIHGASRFEVDDAWSAQRVKRATFSRTGLSPSALAQRRRIKRWVCDALASTHYDVIVARYLGLALFVPFKHWGKLVLDADDIFKTPPASAGGSLVARLKFGARNAVAAMLLRRARHVWLVNPMDRAKFRASRVSRLPNTIALPDTNAVRKPVVASRILMVGYFEHPPNAEGLEWFASRILPKLVERFPQVELHAVGKTAPHFAQRFSAPVVIRGFVDDLASEYASAALVIAPIRSGGGTQIKVLEALAHGRPLISSPFANAGFAEHLVPGEHLTIAETEEEWLDACERAFQNPAVTEAMAAAGQLTVHRTYGTEHMVTVVRKTIDELAGQNRQ